MGSSLLFTGAEWSYDALARAYETIEPIALGELGLEIYPNQIEIITAEQMLDAYASIGLPLMYNHWSFGKQFAYNELLYRKGARGLAYEIVINAVPCGLHSYIPGSGVWIDTLWLHGGQLHGDADAGHGARSFRPQPLLP